MYMQTIEAINITIQIVYTLRILKIESYIVVICKIAINASPFIKRQQTCNI